MEEQNHIDLQLERINKKVASAEEWYQKQQQTRVPYLRQEIVRYQNDLEKLKHDRRSPLYVIVRSRKQIQDKLAVLEKELYTFTDEKLMKDFKETVNFGAVLKNSQDDADRDNLKAVAAAVTELDDNINEFAFDNALNIIEKVKTHIPDTQIHELQKEYGSTKEFLQAYLEKKITVSNSKAKEVMKRLKTIRLSDDDLLLDEEEFKAVNRSQKVNSGKQFCKQCKKIFFCAPNESKLLCKFCGSTQTFVDMNSASTNYSMDNDDNQAQYERCTHFMDILEAFRPREWRNDIPQKVIDDLKALMRQNRFGITRELDVAKIASYLQHLGYVELYEYKYQIMMMFNGVRLPVMTQIQEWKIMFAFLMLQPYFEEVKNTKSLLDSASTARSSFLKYELSAYHIVRMHGYHQFCCHLRLLRVAARHRKQLRQLLLMMRKCGLDYTPEFW